MISQFKMGKPSIKSRKTSQIRSKNRKILFKKQMKNKEEEIADLQIQMHDFKKSVECVGEKVFGEINKCSRENNNLVKWLTLYDEQLKSHQQEIYNLQVRSYFSSQQTPLFQPQNQPQNQPQPQPQPQQEPTYKSLDEYFRSQK